MSPEFIDALKLFGLLSFLAVVPLGLVVSKFRGPIGAWVKAHIKASTAKREEKMWLARKEQQHRHRMEQLAKTQEIASIVVADRALAEAVRVHIDAEYPKVRVEAREDETKPLPLPITKRTKKIKRGR